MRSLLVMVLLALAPAVAGAGHFAPTTIHSCQSVDGRYVVHADRIDGPQPFGPFRWRIIWRDTKENTTHRFEPKELPQGYAIAQLFVTPDGSRIAFWNPLMRHSTIKEKTGRVIGKLGDDGYKTQEAFSNRLVIYTKTGELVKALGVNDLLLDDEWKSVLLLFERVHWLKDYPKLSYRDVPYPLYAMTRVSPDYSILEFITVGNRTVRVSLSDGTILDPKAWPTETAKVPIQMVIVDRGELFKKYTIEQRDNYQPSLDPVRLGGRFPPLPQSSSNPFEGADKWTVVKTGMQSADTPAWLPKEQCLIFTDLKADKTYKATADGQISEVFPHAARGKVGPDGTWVGIAPEGLVRWKPGRDKEVILPKAPSLNDLAIAANGTIYFTTLKDPDKGRLTMIDPKGRATVLFEGTDEPLLWNPNGIALSPDGQYLYMLASRYAARQACLYQFPLDANGIPDIVAGKKNTFLSLGGSPDGVAVDASGTVYVTTDNAVTAYSTFGKKLGSLPLPERSATNLCLANDGRVLYVTTPKTLFRTQLAIAAKSSPGN